MAKPTQPAPGAGSSGTSPSGRKSRTMDTSAQSADTGGKGVIKCCFGCQERTMGCHGTCGRYAEEKAQHNAVAAARRSFLDAEDDTTGYFVDQARRRRQ